MSLFNFNSGSSDGIENDPKSDDVNADNTPGVEFVPPVPKPPVKGVADIASSASEFVSNPENVKQFLNIASALRDGNPTKAAQAIAGVENADLVAQIIQAAAKGINVRPSMDQSPPIGGGGGSGFNNSYANATRLSLDPAPTEVRFATGIKPNTFTPEYQISEEAYASPLHVTLTNFRFPTNTTINTSAKYYNDAILFDLINRVQRNVSFSLPTGFTVANLVTTLNHLCAALEIYYSVSRLLVYGNDPMNKNEGLLALRGTITSSVGEEFLMLKRVLDGLPIPPNLNTLMFYLHQIYLSSELPGSPAIMIAPHGFSSSGLPTWSEIATVRANLISATSTTIFTVLGKAIPNWYGTKLMTGISNPLHDPNFSTMWTNLPYWVTRVTAPTSDVMGPAVADVDTSIRYNAWTNNLDGGIFALMSIYKNTATVGWIPGMIVPLRTAVNTDYNTNRISWAMVSGVTRFWPSDDGDSLSFARDETTTTSVRFSPAVNSCLQFGTERCWGVNGRTILDCTNQLMDWLLSFETIPYKTDRSLSGGMSGTIPGGYKSSPKSSGSKSKPSKRGKRGKTNPPENSFSEEL